MIVISYFFLFLNISYIDISDFVFSISHLNIMRSIIKIISGFQHYIRDQILVTSLEAALGCL
jgi:hypothetical protein